MAKFLFGNLYKFRYSWGLSVEVFPLRSVWHQSLPFDSSTNLIKHNLSVSTDGDCIFKTCEIPVESIKQVKMAFFS